jgi:hypothetical protein
MILHGYLKPDNFLNKETIDADLVASLPPLDDEIYQEQNSKKLKDALLSLKILGSQWRSRTSTVSLEEEEKPKLHPFSCRDLLR